MSYFWRLLFLCACWWYLADLPCASVQEIGNRVVYRDYHGDMFTISSEDCNQTSCDRRQRQAAAIPGEECKCQCAPTHKIFREDIRECVKDIGDCPLAAFVLPYTVERIPLVTLPPAGQLIYPGAHLTLSGVNLSSGSGHLSCVVKVSEILTPKGWDTIEHLTLGRVVFGLYDDASNMFLQWLGNDDDRRLLQHHLVRVRLSCRGERQEGTYEPCAALRVGWALGTATSSTATVPSKQSNYFIIGLCLGILGLMYVLSLLIYLRTRQARRKQRAGEAAASPKSVESGTLSKTGTSNDNRASHDRTSAYHIDSNSRRSDKSHQDDNDETSIQEAELKKAGLQIHPEFFEPDMLASPPPLAQEFLHRIREMISAARARLKNFRFRPTLLVIPEDDYYYQDLTERDIEQVMDKGPSATNHSENNDKSNVYKNLDKPGPSKERVAVESIHGSTSLSISLMSSVHPPQPPPRQMKTKTRKATPVVCRKETFTKPSASAMSPKPDAEMVRNRLRKSPIPVASSRNSPREDDISNENDENLSNGSDNVTKFDIFRHELYKKLQQLQDSQGTSTLNISTKRERPKLPTGNGQDDDMDDWNDSSDSNQKSETVEERCSSRQKKDEGQDDHSNEFKNPGRKVDTPKPPLSNSGSSQKQAFHNKISRRELLQKIQQDQMFNFNDENMQNSTNASVKASNSGKEESDKSHSVTPTSFKSDGERSELTSVTPSISRCSSTSCVTATSNTHNDTSNSRRLPDGNYDALDSLENSGDESSLCSTRYDAESYVTSSETLPPMSSENELRDSEKCSLSSMTTTPTDSLRSTKSSKHKKLKETTKLEFQNNLDRVSKDQNHFTHNGTEKFLIMSQQHSDSTGVYHRNSPRDHQLNSQSDQHNSLSDNESAPSSDAYLQLSNQVAKKLSSRKVPGLDYGSSDEKDKKKLSHLVKNTLGRIGEHFDMTNKIKTVKPSSPVSDNWMLKKEASGASRTNSKIPKRCSPGRSATIYSSESENGDRKKRDKKKETSAKQKSVSSGQNSKHNGRSEKKHKGSKNNTSQSDTESSVCCSTPQADIDSRSGSAASSRRTNYEGSDISSSCRSTPFGNNKKHTGHYTMEVSSGKTTPSGSTSCVSTSSSRCESQASKTSEHPASDSVTSCDTDSISIMSIDSISTGSRTPSNGSYRKNSDKMHSGDAESGSLCSDSMTEDSLNVNGYSSDNDSSDEDNPIDACLTQLANTPVTADGHPFRIDRATKGLDTIQMIKTAGWKHICHDVSKMKEQSHSGMSKNGYNSDDTVSSTSSRSSTSSSHRSKRHKHCDALSPEPQHVSRMLGYFHNGADFTSDSAGTYSSNTDSEDVPSKPHQRRQSRYTHSDQDIAGGSKSSKEMNGHSRSHHKEGRKLKSNAANVIPSTSEEETACSEDVDCESDGHRSARSGGSSDGAGSSSSRSERTHRRRSHASKTKKAGLNGTCKQHVQNRKNESNKSERSGGSRHHHSKGANKSSPHRIHTAAEASRKTKSHSKKEVTGIDLLMGGKGNKVQFSSMQPTDSTENKFVTLISVENGEKSTKN